MNQTQQSLSFFNSRVILIAQKALRQIKRINMTLDQEKLTAQQQVQLIMKRESLLEILEIEESII